MSVSVDELLSLGDDQMANQFSIIFPNGIPRGGDANTISLRSDMQFDPPENVVSVYDIFRKGFKITKTGMLQETTKEFSIDIRLDQQWKVFDDMNAWVNMSYDHTNGTALPESMARSTVIVQAEDRMQSGVKTLTFKYAKPKSIKIQTFDNQSGDPLRITVIFIYAVMEVN